MTWEEVIFMYGWSFPPGGYGERTGLNNSGVETFRSNLMESLAREIIQNSCDARHPDADGPVEVRFELLSIPADALPGRTELEKALVSSRKVWDHLQESAAFFDQALAVVRSAEIRMLKISDYRTTGLTGAKEEFRGSWNALVKSSGVSEKSSQSGGSFGIGKNAPFACSKLRTVFYGTLDKNGTLAFQGVARLVTHKNDRGELTQGTGFFGELQENKPIIGLERLAQAGIDARFIRSETGTDLYVPGFAADDNWEASIVRAVLEHFFVAILEEKLIVKIGEIEINADSFADLLEQYGEDEDGEPLLVSKYFKAYTSPKEPPFYEVQDFGDMGEMELYLITGKDLPKRVAMFRSTGMKILDKRFQSILPFAGVFVAKGEKLNEFLRKLEPPNHQSWEIERHDDKKFAKKHLTKLYDWVREHLKSLTTSEESETLDIEGMSQFLPDDVDDGALNGDQSEGLRTLPTEFKFREVLPTVAELELAKKETAVGKQPLENEENESENGDEDEQESGGGMPKEKIGDSDEKGGKEGQDGSGKGSGETPARQRRLTNLKQVLAFCVNPTKGFYQVSFVPNADGEGNLSFTAVGEDGREAAPVRDAWFKESSDKVPVAGKGKVGPFPMKGGEKNTIIIELDNTVRYSLEVTFRAN
jgi:hypothetical protein